MIGNLTAVSLSGKKKKVGKQTRKMAMKTKTGICAIIITAIASLFVLISFCTSFWLVNDGKIADPKFLRIGLWEVCFRDFEDFRHQYDYRFTGCWWVFEEEYYIIFDFLLPGFFIATQFFFTLCMTLVLVAAFLTWMYCFCSRDHERYLLLLLSNGANLCIAGVCGLIAVSIFGANGDNRDWMPYWQHNDLSWSYGFACVGAILLIPAGVLFLVEAKRTKYKRFGDSQPASQYSMGMQPQPSAPYTVESHKASAPHHTDI